MILLDTHALLWLRGGDRRLGRRARSAVDRAWTAEQLAVSAITFWEISLLKEKGRIKFPEDVALWRREQLRQGLIELPIDGEIGIRAVSLSGLPTDPADRFIVATAMEGHRLVTADQRILDWPGPLNRLDATE